MRLHRLVSLVSVALAATLAACSKEPLPKPQAAKPMMKDDRLVFPTANGPLTTMVVEPVKAAQPGTIRLNGRLTWDEDRTVRVSAPFAGRVTSIAAKPGDAVRAGQTLATLASADLGQAQADIRKAATDFALAEKSLARVRDLVANGVLPQKDLATAEADFGRAESELVRARARVKLYGGAEQIDQSFAIRSPIAGTVVERNINPGQELRPDAPPPGALFVVTDPARLWVMLEATERDLSVLRVGRAVALTASAYPAEQFTATIDLIADFIDPATRTVKVRARLDNSGRKLKSEMFLVGTLETDAPIGVEVPARAVMLVESKHYVFIEEAPGRFHRVEVQVADESGGRVAISKGLAAGTRVVVEGGLILQRLYLQLHK